MKGGLPIQNKCDSMGQNRQERRSSSHVFHNRKKTVGPVLTQIGTAYIDNILSI